MESLLPTLDGDVPADCHIYAGANGSIGIIVGITKSKYRLLKKLETELVKYFARSNPGQLDHQAWRAFKTDRRKERRARSFVDGNIIERFLDLAQDDAAKVVEALNKSILSEAAVQDSGDNDKILLADLTAAVQEMSRLH